MCGITGYTNHNLRIKDSPTTLKNMMSYIQHRGPDEAGYYVDDHLAMGATRLSIIDIQNASQPLCDQSQRYWICYNGELYNYKELKEDLQDEGASFRTNSDTEVVLQSWIYWKEESLKKFNGAFAFAIYDTQERSLILARDRFGKRPLFYFEKNGEFLFASEMKAFLGYDDFVFEWDRRQLPSMLTLWTPLPHQSGFKNIKQLPMGEYIKVENGQITTQKKYAHLDFANELSVQSESDAKEKIRHFLSESVRLRLRSDVEVGVYLSGGLDSSIIATLASEMSSHPIRTFSVEFEDKYFDESEDQKRLTNQLRSKHTAISISDNDISDNFPTALFHAEVPAFRTAFVPMFLLSRKVKEEGLKVVLSGEGADETFLGYDIFKETLLRMSWEKMSAEERKDKLAKIHPYLNHFKSDNQTYLLGLYQQFSKEKMPGLFSHEMRFQNGLFSTRLLEGPGDPFKELYDLINKESYYSRLSAIEKNQWLEFKTLLSGYLLSTQGDRMSLAHGVENRCPFLDPSVVNLSSSINLRFDDGFNEKYLLKEAYKDKLPEQILNKRKFPYRAPDSSAFVKSRPDYLDLLISEAELKKTEILNTDFAKQLINKIFKYPPDKISTRENQSFVFLLSICILDNLFIKKRGIEENISLRNIENILVKRIDNRNRL